MARRITRRTFLTNGSLALAGLTAAPAALAQRMGGGGGMGGGGMGGGTTIIDPPVGPAFAEPPVAGVRGQRVVAGMLRDVVDVALVAAREQRIVNGAWASVLAYEPAVGDPFARFVAPTIRVRANDHVTLAFANRLPGDGATTLVGHPKYVTNVHVHGWHVSPGVDLATGKPADDVHRVLPPLESLTYAYDLAKQRPGSIGLYHPHVHGSVAEQFWAGLVGLLDVEDAADSPLRGHRRFLALLKDVTISAGAPAAHTSSDYMRGKEGAVCTVNGLVNPALDVEPGEVFRLRFVNGSDARFYRLQLQSHAMYVAGTDGGHLDRPYPLTDLLLSSGERADVLFKAPTTAGSYKLLSLPYSRMGMMSSEQITLMTVRVARKGSSHPKTVPSSVNPDAVRIEDDPMAMPIAKEETFALSMSMGRGYINGLSFDDPTGSHGYTVMSTTGTHELWHVVNQSNMDHPWHQHVNDAQVIATSGGDAVYARYAGLLKAAPAWKDTIIVPKMGSVTLRIPILDHAGATMFHCHILEHEDIGMMGMWHIMEGGMGGGM